MLYAYTHRSRTGNRIGRSAVAALLALTVACEDQAVPLAPSMTATARIEKPGPDVAKILFTANVRGSVRRDLHSVNPDGSELTRLETPTDGHDQTPVWSPDFRQIAFSTLVEDLEQGAHRFVHVMDADGTLRASFGSGSRPRWSPDGRRLLFSDGERAGLENSDLYVGSLNGQGRVTQLTFTPEFEGDATWSPDGRRIAFVRHAGDAAEIYVMDANGRGPAQKLTNCEAEGARCLLPSWSVIPGDERILIHVEKDVPELRLIRADGGPSSTLLVDPFLQEAAASWSPDGRAVAFISARDAADPTTRSDVYTFDITSATVRRVTFLADAGLKAFSTGWSR